MAYEEAIRSITLNADASLAQYTGAPGMPGSADPNYGKQYRFVKITGARTCGLSTASTDLSIGVMQNKPQVTNMAATVAIRGVTQVMAGAAITAGAQVMSNTAGKAVTYVAGTGVLPLGIAVEAASGADTLTSVLLQTN